jgi:hypothetical protein
LQTSFSQDKKILKKKNRAVRKWKNITNQILRKVLPLLVALSIPATLNNRQIRSKAISRGVTRSRHFAINRPPQFSRQPSDQSPMGVLNKCFSWSEEAASNGKRKGKGKSKANSVPIAASALTGKGREKSLNTGG